MTPSQRVLVVKNNDEKEKAIDDAGIGGRARGSVEFRNR